MLSLSDFGFQLRDLNAARMQFQGETGAGIHSLEIDAEHRVKRKW
jgi:hypothetical protein